jgi:hypothetical protein
VSRAGAKITGVDRLRDLRRLNSSPVSPPVRTNDASCRTIRKTIREHHRHARNAVVDKDDQIGYRKAVDDGRVLKTLPVRFGARNMTRQCGPEIFMEPRRAFSLKKLSGDTR